MKLSILLFCTALLGAALAAQAADVAPATGAAKPASAAGNTPVATKAGPPPAAGGNGGGLSSNGGNTGTQVPPKKPRCPDPTKCPAEAKVGG